ncbi:S24/S26 family peptidase [Geminisphaera colitermitum]|uniref:S24/S26 family peptidase n=1 Tax=Geminisphaera colitermitum TaxID=1148786 RepID=UPI000158E0F5|nr:S24/S26 family peptidase [Geminisphaera colitermitum]
MTIWRNSVRKRKMDGMEYPLPHSLNDLSARFATLTLMAMAGLFSLALITVPLRGAPSAESIHINPVTPVQIDTALRDAHHLAGTRDDLDVVRVAGRSMLPFFGDGAVLVIKTTFPAANLHPGMLVIYTNHLGERIAHRVEERDTAGDWIVRGWNNTECDTSRVNDRNLVGVVYATFHANPQTLVGVSEPLATNTPVALAAPAK